MACKISCYCCANLDRGRRTISKSGHYFKYGCKECEYIPFWISENKSESELKTGGCSEFYESKLKQGALFRFITENNKYVIMYCGKIGNEYLLYNQTLKTFRLVKQDWIKKHRHNIYFKKAKTTKFNTAEEKERFRRNLAKAKKERYIRDHDCNRN